MPITILRPQPPPSQRTPAVSAPYSGSDSDSEGGGVDVHGDVSMGGLGRGQDGEEEEDDDADEILTPGTIITSNPQWMR